LRLLGKEKTRLSVLTGYDQIIEQSEMIEKELPVLSPEYLKKSH